ncbi:MATE family efflux transporter [uncultured Clostridium sp.]|uniref:MATE family efflux transporter n=1 Tax=uncultured Clostridium sp. TaxID=59620 RepID=UPI00260582C9|nr:MATE family efflux transporter [uncultured Clostridium sp.]
MSNKKQATDLGKGKISKLLLQLALPAIIAQIVNVLYNIVDRVFIGRIPEVGAQAMAGVGVAFPIIIIVSAFSALIGGGGAPLVAIKMGQKDKEGAEKILSNSFTSLIVIGVILTVGFLIFKRPILMAFGASPATIDYALQYLTIYLFGTIFVQIALGLNPFINAQGFAKISMMSVMLGAVINIILDPIFIFTFNMGVRGAALATLIGQMASAIWVLKFILKDSPLKLRKEFLIPEAKVILGVMALGIAPFIMQTTESLVIVSMNNQLGKFGELMGPGGGDLAIGSMTIMSSIMQIILLPLIGISQGAQPIISYNYGAKQYGRVKATFKLLLTCCMGYTTLMWAGLMAMPTVFVKLFNDSPELIQITSWSIKLFFAGIFVLGAQVACQQTFLALGQAKMSLMLALLRKVFLLTPLIFILPSIMKQDQLMATYLAESVADVLAATTTITCFIIFYKKTLSKIEDLEEADEKASV